MTLDEARELAQWDGLASAPEYLRALLVVQFATLDRMGPPAPPVAAVVVKPMEDAPEPKLKRKG